MGWAPISAFEYAQPLSKTARENSDGCIGVFSLMGLSLREEVSPSGLRLPEAIEPRGQKVPRGSTHGRKPWGQAPNRADTHFRVFSSATNSPREVLRRRQEVRQFTFPGTFAALSSAQLGKFWRPVSPIVP